MTGVAALAICAAFTSCSKSEELFDQGAINQNQANLVVEKYNQAFLKYVGGTIAPNQTWGFGGYAAATRGFSTNHNLWGDPTADGGKWNYKVPPALTERQKLRVKLYFQYNPWLTYEDPGWTDFFVQQVYKGGTSPIASQSLEEYPTGNGGSAIGGEQMDLLTVGTTGEGAQTANYYDHVNDFNNGDYNGGKTVPVLNTGASTNNYGTDSHPDQITLMLSSKSDCVGYWSSNGSTGHNDRCALAGADVIDAWANSAAATALNIDLGDPVYDEEWNRSFVGLDYDGVNGDNIYAKELDANWQPTNNIRYAKFEDAKNGKEYAWDGTKVVKIDDLIAIDPYIRDKEGNKVPYTINERNMFIGEKADISQSDLIIQKEGYGDVIDLTVIYGKIDDACLPCNGKLYEWTKNIGGRDHVYSDWIVTLTKAEKQEIVVDQQDVCIIAEDLNAEDATDFDFNDVVFTVHYDTDNSATITLYATGATQPIWIGSSVNEVHQLFATKNNDPSLAQKDSKTGLYKMINTGAKADVNNLAYPTFSVTSSKSTRGKDIVIMVNKLEKNAEGVYEDKGNWIELPANGGEPAAKLCVGVDYATKHRWCNERQSIKDIYPRFYDWVANNPTLIWWLE